MAGLLPLLLQGVVLADPSAVVERLPPMVAIQQVLAPCDIAKPRPQPQWAQGGLAPGCLNLQVVKVAYLQLRQLDLFEQVLQEQVAVPVVSMQLARL